MIYRVICADCGEGWETVKASLEHPHFQDDDRDHNKKLTAVQKRFCAIGAVSKTAINADGSRNWTHSNVVIADLILDLVELGRTEKWQRTVRQWSRMVRNDDAQGTWGLLQGMVYAVHAA